MVQPACLEKMILVWGRECLLQKNRASEAPTGLSSYKSDNKD